MRRRDFVIVVGGALATWPLAVRAQQPTMSMVAFLRTGSADTNSRNVAAFRKGLGFVESQNVTIEYYWREDGTHFKSGSGRCVSLAASRSANLFADLISSPGVEFGPLPTHL